MSSSAPPKCAAKEYCVTPSIPIQEHLQPICITCFASVHPGCFHRISEIAGIDISIKDIRKLPHIPTGEAFEKELNGQASENPSLICLKCYNDLLGSDKYEDRYKRSSAVLLSSMLLRANPQDNGQSIIPFYSLEVNKRKVLKSRFTCQEDSKNICMKIAKWLKDSEDQNIGNQKIGNFIKSYRIQVALISVVPMVEDNPRIFELRNAFTGARHPSLGGTRLTKESLIRGVQRFNDACGLSKDGGLGPLILQELEQLDKDDIQTIGSKAYDHINQHFPTGPKKTFAFVKGMLRVREGSREEFVGNETIDGLLDLAERARDMNDLPREQICSILRFLHLNCSAFLGLAICPIDGSHRITALSQLHCGQYPGDNEDMEKEYMNYNVVQGGAPIEDIPIYVYLPELLTVDGIDHLRDLSGQSQLNQSRSQRIDFFNFSSDFLSFINKKGLLTANLQAQIDQLQTPDERKARLFDHMNQISKGVIQWLGSMAVSNSGMGIEARQHLRALFTTGCTGEKLLTALKSKTKGEVLYFPLAIKKTSSLTARYSRREQGQQTNSISSKKSHSSMTTM